MSPPPKTLSGGTALVFVALYPSDFLLEKVCSEKYEIHGTTTTPTRTRSNLWKVSRRSARFRLASYLSLREPLWMRRFFS